MHFNKAITLTILRRLAVAMACLMTPPAAQAADQWDDIAQKFVDQEQAHFVRRTADKDGIVIVLSHPLISERVVLAITDGRPAMSFQFNSSGVPGDDAFELMSRGGHLLTGKDAAAVIRNLRRALAAAGKETYGVGFVVADGLAITCVAPPDSSRLSFLVAGD
jgi:hypothetical protein